MKLTLIGLKRIKFFSMLLTAGVIIITVSVIVFASSNFSQHVFYVNLHKYKQVSEQGEIVRYAAGSAPFIDVQMKDQNRDIIINHETYSILQIVSPPGTHQYRVIYPNGHQYKVEDQSGNLLSFDAKREIFFGGGSVYINGERQLQDGEEDEEYYPSELVTAAYSEYHTKQGSWAVFILSILFFIYGWCGFRYEKFQTFLFWISLRWIWVEDAEPSDFHYFTCKVGGIIAMIAAVYFAIQSFFVG